MKTHWLSCLLAMVCFATAVVGAEKQKPATIEGYVLDSACAFVRDVKKPLGGGQCAIDCAKAGSPLVVLTDDGKIYWPISDAMPAVGQNARLMEFAGKRVVAKGTVYERGGSLAMVIEKIEAKADTK